MSNIVPSIHPIEGEIIQRLDQDMTAIKSVGHIIESDGTKTIGQYLQGIKNSEDNFNGLAKPNQEATKWLISEMKRYLNIIQQIQDNNITPSNTDFIEEHRWEKYTTKAILVLLMAQKEKVNKLLATLPSGELTITNSQIDSALFHFLSNDGFASSCEKTGICMCQNGNCFFSAKLLTTENFTPGTGKLSALEAGCSDGNHQRLDRLPILLTIQEAREERRIIVEEGQSRINQVLSDMF